MLHAGFEFMRTSRSLMSALFCFAMSVFSHSSPSSNG